jgi:hypothetical protein
MSPLGDFVRRPFPDATKDLICTRCYQTVVRSADENILAKAELEHQCARQRPLNVRPEPIFTVEPRRAKHTTVSRSLENHGLHQAS